MSQSNTQLSEVTPTHILNVYRKLLSLQEKSKDDRTLNIDGRSIPLDTKSITTLIAETFNDHMLSTSTKQSDKTKQSVQKLKMDKSNIDARGVIKFLTHLVIDMGNKGYCDASCLSNSSLYKLSNNSLVGIEGKHIKWKGSDLSLQAALIHYKLNPNMFVRNMLFQLTNYSDSVLKGNHIDLQLFRERLSESDVTGSRLMIGFIESLEQQLENTLVYRDESDLVDKEENGSNNRTELFYTVKLGKGKINLDKEGRLQVNRQPYYVRYNTSDRLIRTMNSVDDLDLKQYKVYVKPNDESRLILISKDKSERRDIFQSDEQRESVYNRLAFVSKLASILLRDESRKQMNNLDDELSDEVEVQLYDARTFERKNKLPLSLVVNDLPNLTESTRVTAKREMQECQSDTKEDCIINSNADLSDETRLYLFANGMFKGKEMGNRK